MGGFECAVHRRPGRKRIDVIGATRHDLEAAHDCEMLQAAGVRTVRDGLRWHLIEQTTKVYDCTSLLPILEASQWTGIQVTRDLCH